MAVLSRSPPVDGGEYGERARTILSAAALLVPATGDDRLEHAHRRWGR